MQINPKIAQKKHFINYDEESGWPQLQRTEITFPSKRYYKKCYKENNIILKSLGRFASQKNHHMLKNID